MDIGVDYDFLGGGLGGHNLGSEGSCDGIICNDGAGDMGPYY